MIAIAGTAPGMGKSTLVHALRELLTARGLRVEVFVEEDVLRHPAYADVAAEFGRTGVVPPARLLADTATYVDTVTTAAPDVVIVDALVPFLPSMFAWGHTEQEIATFLTDLRVILAPVDPVVVHLDGDPERSLPRAAAREGDEWLAWFVDKLRADASPAPVHDPASAAARLRTEREASLRLLDRAGWLVEVIPDADVRRAEAISAEALDRLAPRLAA